MRIAVALTLLASWLMIDVRAAEVRPNIIVVLYDDATAHDVAQMPTIKRSVREAGIDFTRFYATEPICCPSRATLLTGEYVHNHRVEDNDTRDGGWARFYRRGHEQRTFALELEQLGYKTGYFGKYLNHYGERLPTHVPPGWDEWFATVDWRGWYDYSTNHNGTVVGPPGNGPSAYFDRMLADEALEWTLDSIDSGEPTFSLVSVRAPKSHYDHPPGHGDEFSTTQLEPKPSFNERDVGDKPRYVRRLERFSNRLHGAMTRRLRQRLRLMLEADDFVGALVDSLASRNELDDTYIFVLSDNGFMQGEHRLKRQKLVPYEESVRLPLYVRGPGIQPGSSSTRLTSMIDLFGTFVDIAGGTELRDGRSLVPILAGDDIAWRDALLIENMATHQSIVPEYFGVITQTHKFVRHKTDEPELYALQSDPFETRSQHKHARSTVRELLPRLHALRECSAATCREADRSVPP